MEIVFKSSKLEKACNSLKKGNRTWGESLAKKIGQRLRELRAADNLLDISHLPPPRCHELTGKRTGKFAVDLSGNVRLVFEPFSAPISRLANGGIDLSQVSKILILEVVDYHGQ